MDTATSATRAMDQTDEAVNQQIERRTWANVTYYAEHPEEIDKRLQELDQEWDIERWFELNAGILSFAGLALAAARSRLWLVLPLTIQGYLLQHALQGWCPPLPVFRRLGVRTQLEIETERYALKALRGDFQQAQGAQEATEATVI